MNIQFVSSINFFSSIKLPNIKQINPIIAIVSAIALSIFALYSLYYAASVLRSWLWRESPIFLPIVNPVLKLKPSSPSLDQIQVDGETALTQAVTKEDLSTVRQLIFEGASVNQANNIKHTPLQLASILGNIEIVRLLLDAGADPSTVCEDNGYTPLDVAAVLGNRKVVELLTKGRPQDLHRKNLMGETPLHLATEFGRLEVAKFLLEQRVNPDIINENENTPLHIAASKGHLDFIDLLLENKANPDLQRKLDGCTPLHAAAFSGHLDVVNTLLDHGVNLNALDNTGNTPLHLAAYKGYKATAESLVTAGGDLDAMNHSGQTPAMLAYNEGYKNLGHSLIQQEKEQISQFWLELKLFIHKLGLDVQLNFADREISLNSFNVFITHEALVHSVSQTTGWIKKAPPGWTSSDTECICGILGTGIRDRDQNLESDFANSMHAHQNEEILIFPIGWLDAQVSQDGKQHGHAVSVAIYKDLLIKCDRAVPESGLSIYKINHPNNLEKAVEKLLKDYHHVDNEQFFKKGLDEQLGLQLIHHIEHSLQKSKTCTWTSSAKLDFHAVLYLYLIKKGFAPDEAETYSQLMYKVWAHDDRLLAIQDLLTSEIPDFIRDDLLAAAFDLLSRKNSPDASTQRLITVLQWQAPNAVQLAEYFKSQNAVNSPNCDPRVVQYNFAYRSISSADAAKLQLVDDSSVASLLERGA